MNPRGPVTRSDGGNVSSSATSLRNTRRGFLAAGSALLATGSTVTASGERSADVTIDGDTGRSPLIADIAEEIERTYSDVTVTVDDSGTRTGFRRFIAGETDVQYARRPILPREAEAARGVKYEDSVVVPDGVAAFHRPDHWCTCMRGDEAREVLRDGDVEIWGELDSDAALDAEGRLSSVEPAAAERVLGHGPRSHQYAIGAGAVGYYEIPSQHLYPPRTASTEVAPLVRLGFVYVDRSSLQRESVTAFVRRLERAGTSVIDSPPHAPAVDAI